MKKADREAIKGALAFLEERGYPEAAGLLRGIVRANERRRKLLSRLLSELGWIPRRDQPVWDEVRRELKRC